MQKEDVALLFPDYVFCVRIFFYVRISALGIPETFLVLRPKSNGSASKTTVEKRRKPVFIFGFFSDFVTVLFLCWGGGRGGGWVWSYDRVSCFYHVCPSEVIEAAKVISIAGEKKKYSPFIGIDFNCSFYLLSPMFFFPITKTCGTLAHSITSTGKYPKTPQVLIKIFFWCCEKKNSTESRDNPLLHKFFLYQKLSKIPKGSRSHFVAILRLRHLFCDTPLWFTKTSNPINDRRRL